MTYDDQSELLEVVTPDGRLTGRLLPRLQIHREGHWHLTRTVWVVLTGEPNGPGLVLQQRGFTKDTWGGLLDVSSAGHLAPDDPDPWRELEEELGVRPTEGPLIQLGTRRVEGLHIKDGLVDRELQDLWLWLAPLALEDLRPQAGEIEALLGLDLEVVPDLDGPDARTPARRMDAVTREIASAFITSLELTPGLGPFATHLAELARSALAGERDLRYDPKYDLRAET
ncbi:MAG: NUDIX domain-containing protein [Chloroflexi bacterium]|nr:NUDIX domain-containing protein [Chloroflexota bacterium]